MAKYKKPVVKQGWTWSQRGVERAQLQLVSPYVWNVYLVDEAGNPLTLVAQGRDYLDRWRHRHHFDEDYARAVEGLADEAAHVAERVRELRAGLERQQAREEKLHRACVELQQGYGYEGAEVERG